MQRKEDSQWPKISVLTISHSFCKLQLVHKTFFPFPDSIYSLLLYIVAIARILKLLSRNSSNFFTVHAIVNHVSQQNLHTGNHFQGLILDLLND